MSPLITRDCICYGLADTPPRLTLANALAGSRITQTTLQENMTHSMTIWPNESWACASPTTDARDLNVPLKEISGVVRSFRLLGMQSSPVAIRAHALQWPSDSEIWKVITMISVRRDPDSVNTVLECLDIGTCLEVQEHDSSGDPLHANRLLLSGNCLLEAASPKAS